MQVRVRGVWGSVAVLIAKGNVGNRQLRQAGGGGCMPGVRVEMRHDAADVTVPVGDEDAGEGHGRDVRRFVELGVSAVSCKDWGWCCRMMLGVLCLGGGR